MKKLVAMTAFAVIGLPYVWNGHVYANTHSSYHYMDPSSASAIFAKSESAKPWKRDPTNMWILYADSSSSKDSTYSVGPRFYKPIWY